MVNCWFGYLGSPYERDCYLGVPLESQTTNPNQQPKPLVEQIWNPISQASLTSNFQTFNSYKVPTFFFKPTGIFPAKKIQQISNFPSHFFPKNPRLPGRF